MVLTLLISRGMFRYNQEYLRHMNGKRFALTNGIHQTLDDLFYMEEELGNNHIQIYKLMSFTLVMGSYRDTSGSM